MQCDALRDQWHGGLVMLAAQEAAAPSDATGTGERVVTGARRERGMVGRTRDRLRLRTMASMMVMAGVAFVPR